MKQTTKLAMEELAKSIERAKPNLSKIKDVDKWLDEIRGDYGN